VEFPVIPDGRKVVRRGRLDESGGVAVNTKKISVTAEDIARGMRGDSSCCAIALACQRLDFDEIEVDSEEITFKLSATIRGRAKLPHAASRFVLDFDEDKDLVSPLEFEARFEELNDAEERLYDRDTPYGY
jgi:hypothetical protein